MENCRLKCYTFSIIKALTIILLVTSFFYPTLASWVFVAFFVILEAYVLVTSRKRENSFAGGAHFNQEEKQTIEKYHLYFRYPYTAKSLSTSLSLIALSGIIWVPWLLYNHLWLQAIIVGLNYIVAQHFSTKLNIRFYLHDAVEKLGQEEHRKEMLLVDSICNKLSERGFRDLNVWSKVGEKLENYDCDSLTDHELRLKAVGVNFAIFTISDMITKDLQKVAKELNSLKQEDINKVFFIVSYVTLFQAQKYFWENYIHNEGNAKIFEKYLFQMFEKTAGVNPNPPY